MNNNTKTILTLAAGAIAGAVTALLLAPQTGNDTRRAIRKTAQNLKDDLNTTIQQGLDKIKELRGEAEDMAEGVMGGAAETGRTQTSMGATGTSGSSSLGTSGSMGSSLGSTSGSTGSGFGTSGNTGNRGAI